MEIGLAVGGAFLSSALNVLFDRLAPNGDLLNMFHKHKDYVQLLKKLKMTLRGLQAVLSDAENKQASNPSVSDWLNELRDAVDSAENLIEEVNYEALRHKVEGQHQSLAETSNQQVSHLSLSLSDEFFLNIKDKLEENIETLEELQKQIGWLDLKSCLDSGKQETRRPSTSVNDESDIFGRQSEIKTLAGMLRSKSTIEEWKRILRSEIWEFPDNGMLPALMLSYNELPAHLKRCFSYCAIFPKDYQFYKEQVIQLWIANGLVQKLQKDETVEELGNQYILELRSRSLLDRVPDSFKWKEGTFSGLDLDKYSQMDGEKFVMHDLLNDLAQITSSKHCTRLEDIEGSHMLERTRHLSYSMGDGNFSSLSKGDGDFGKLKTLYKLEQLRTLLPIIRLHFFADNLSKRVLHNILPRLTFLRALPFSRYNIKELPNDLFIKLKLLRFLDLSWTKIKQLPDSICVLYNLETLIVSSCDFLEELPLQMGNLINLRYLDIRRCSRLKMPLHPSKLKSL